MFASLFISGLYQIADATKEQTDLHPDNGLPAAMFTENPALSRFIVQCRVFIRHWVFIRKGRPERRGMFADAKYNIVRSVLLSQESITRNALAFYMI